MTFWALIPVKTVERCKTRLRHVLSDVERCRLVRAMLCHVTAAACAAEGVDRVALLSPEELEAPDEILHIPDRGFDLNSALTRALPDIARAGAKGYVVLPADLPLLTPQDVGRMAAIGRAGGLAIAPDWRGKGTNALAAPIGVSGWFNFGEDSFRAHFAAAVRMKRTPTIVRAPGLSFDLDEPEALTLANGLLKAPVIEADKSRRRPAKERC